MVADVVGVAFGSDLAAVRPQGLPADMVVDAAGSPLGPEGGGVPGSPNGEMRASAAAATSAVDVG